ncbi:MAG: hypothetical protein ABFQ65_03060 [Nanoarchaeota archaeon]
MKKIILSGVICISLLMFIFAAHTITTSTAIIPEDISSIINISVSNTDALVGANISQVNITLPSGVLFTSGTNSTNAGTHTFVNTSSVLSWSNDAIVMNLTSKDFLFNVTIATAGTYSITVTTVNVSGISSSNVNIISNDTNYPLVSITAPVTGGNYSGSFSLTATITDDTPSLVYFNVTNSSGGQNGTFTASNTSATSWNATINTSTYVDGLYNITVYANDSNNQLNSSILVYNIRVDNTNPTSTYFYCTPTSVYIGATVTCTCTDAADGGSGLASAAVFTENPSTTTAGTFTETCTITDRAGNSIAPTTTYTVSTRPSGGSASGTTTQQQWTMTYTSTENQFLEGYTRSMKAKERIKLKVGNEDHFVGIKSVTTTSATIEIASDPIEITLDIGEDAKADVNDDGIYDIYVVLNNIVDNKADITITKIMEKVLEGEEPITTTGEIVTSEETPTEKQSYVWVWIVVIGIVLVIIGARYKIKKK